MQYRLGLGAVIVTLALGCLLTACNSDNSGYSLDTVIGQENGGIQTSTRNIILFESLRAGQNGEVMAIAADGEKPIRLTSSGYHDTTPAWSPDGTRILFSAAGGSQADLWWANVDNTPVLNSEGETSYFYKITDGKGFNLAADWSTQNVIAFHSDRDNSQLEIYTINPDGTLLARITDNTASDNNPSWSPDGTLIAFSSNRNAGTPEIFIMEADGRNARQITTTAAGSASLAPAWSPDGTRLLYVLQNEADGTRDIYSMDANGADQVQLTTDGSGNHFPCWSPDGTQIAYERTASENTADIWLMNADGTNKRALAPARERDAYPAWSPVL